jgi:hypothetical protein
MERTTLKASVTVQCEESSLGAVREFAQVLERFGVGSTAHITNGQVVGGDVAALCAFVAARSAEPDDAAVPGARFMSLVLDVQRVGMIECGSHVGAMPTNVIVEVHPLCVTCGSAADE